MVGKTRDYEVEKKPTSAAKCGFNRSKLRIVSHIATGNAFTCLLDGDFAPHTRIIRIADAVGSLRSQHGASAMRTGAVYEQKRRKAKSLDQFQAG